MKRIWKQMILLVAVLLVTPVILMVISTKASAADDYTFGSETINEGYSNNPTNRNAEDGSYNTLVEEDQYTDTNFSGTTETVTTGTANGGAFSSSLDTDDATRRAYTEANANPVDGTQNLVPTSDVSIGFDTTYPSSPTTHFDKLDEGTSNDGDTTYNTAVTTGDRDVFGVADLTGIVGTPGFSVTIHYWAQRAATGTSSMDVGLRIGTTDYVGIDNANAGASYAELTYTWSTDPSTSSAWTEAGVNAAQIYMQCDDANPDVKVTCCYLAVAVDYANNYKLDITITYSSVTSTSQTISYNVICQGYRSAAENFGVYAWDYTGLSWTLKTTVQAASDTDYNFNLLTTERDGAANEVKIRIVGLTETSDTTQDVVYFDLLKVNRITKGYNLSIEMSATTVAEYGNITLRIKGYTSAETFTVDVYNYTSSGWDTSKVTITSLSNTWQTTFDLSDAHHRSTQTVKIRFLDSTVYTADTTQDTLYLDVVWVTRYHKDPTITLFGSSPQIVGEGQTVYFWATYTDYDNEAPTYFYLHMDASDISMTANNSGDTAYWDSKAYYLNKADLSLGPHTYYYKTIDANSGIITTASANVYVNDTPSLSGDTVIPATGDSGQEFRFEVVFTDTDGDMPTYVKAVIASIEYACTEDDAGDTDTTDGKLYYKDKIMAGGDWEYFFKAKDTYNAEVTTTPKNLHVNNVPALSAFGLDPAPPLYVTTELTFTCTFTDADNDLPTAIKWRENLGVIQNESMIEVDILDVTTSDGKDYYYSCYLSHGNHDFDFWATDGTTGVSGGSDSLTISNRAPEITNGPGTDPAAYRNTAWGYDFDATDADSDTISWEVSGPAWLTINGASGYLSGTTPDAPDSYAFTVYANDSYSGSDSYSFNLHVNNRVPVITNGPGTDPSEYRNTAWYYDFDATDADSDSINWDASCPAWLSIAADGNLTGTTSDTPGDYPITVYANDSYGGSDDYAFTLHINNRIPVIDSSGNTTQQEGSYLAYHVIAHDDDGDELTYELSTNASAWAAISGEWVNGTATGVGWYEFTVWANDSYGGSDSEHWHLTVTVVYVNDPPVFTSTPVYNVANNSAYYYDADATDSDPIIYGLATDCPHLAIDSDTGEVTGTPDVAGDYYCNVTASDGINPPSYQNFTLHVTTTAPSFTSTPTEYWEHNIFYSYDANASDPESEDLVFDLEGNGTAFLSVHQLLGYVNGTPLTIGWWYVNISVTDYSFVVWQNFTFYSNNTAPVITTSPGLTGTNGTAYYYDADATDLNGDDLSWDYTDKPVWMIIDPDTGECAGTPVLIGDYDVELRVWDGYIFTYQNWTINVTAPAIPEVPAEEAYDPGECILGLGLLMGAIVLIYSMISKRHTPKKSERKGGKKKDVDG